MAGALVWLGNNKNSVCDIVKNVGQPPSDTILCEFIIAYKFNMIID